MRVRALLALTWSLLVALSGGWLVLSPWAVGQQPGSGSWSAVTNAQVRTGAGLLALAAAGLVLAAVEAVSALREAGLLARRAGPSEAGDGRYSGQERPGAASGDLDRALVSLATTLAADLERNRRPGAAEPSRTVDAKGEE